MRGASRLTIAGLAAALALGPAGASAQQAQPAASSTPPADTVGPRELQNFSLQGTVTKPADQPPPAPSPRVSPTRGEQATTTPPPIRPARRAPAALEKSAPVARHIEAAALPPSSAGRAAAPAPIVAPPAAQPAVAPAPLSAEPPPTVAPQHRVWVLPWLLALLAAVVGAAFLFWRSRTREALAGGPQVDFLAPPEPLPAPSAPAPAPPPSAPPPQPAPPSLGIVSSGLRPWLEIIPQPLRCIVTDDSVTLEIALELFNSGNLPARDVIVEAALINAGADQEQALAAFFARPPANGERMEVIPPLARTGFATQIVMPRTAVQPFDVGGRWVFVPLLALNGFYRRGSGDGQTSVAFLVGREGKSDKLAPFRLDLGPRIFRGLGARPLPGGVRL